MLQNIFFVTFLLYICIVKRTEVHLIFFRYESFRITKSP